MTALEILFFPPMKLTAAIKFFFSSLFVLYVIIMHSYTEISLGVFLPRTHFYSCNIFLFTGTMLRSKLKSKSGWQN